MNFLLLPFISTKFNFSDENFMYLNFIKVFFSISFKNRYFRVQFLPIIILCGMIISTYFNFFLVFLVILKSQEGGPQNFIILIFIIGRIKTDKVY